MSVRKYWTWAQVKTKIMNDLDLNEETFIRPSELLEYCNEAIDEAEAEIHTLKTLRNDYSHNLNNLLS